jgi:hypothetical protein
VTGSCQSSEIFGKTVATAMKVIIPRSAQLFTTKVASREARLSMRPSARSRGRRQTKSPSDEAARKPM